MVGVRNIVTLKEVGRLAGLCLGLIKLVFCSVVADYSTPKSGSSRDRAAISRRDTPLKEFTSRGVSRVATAGVHIYYIANIFGNWDCDHNFI